MKVPRKILRRMGFARDQQGIMNRYLREGPGWKEHLEKSRAFIHASFAGRSLDSVAVLGSGWLLDVPLEALSARFSRIFLVDLLHPPQVIKKVGKLPNVELLEADLTGGAVGQLWEQAGKRGQEGLEQLAENLHLEHPLPGLRPDAVISVNLLTQLDIIPLDYLKKKGLPDGNAMKRLRETIQAFHLSWITAVPGCLITDTREVITDRKGRETRRELLFAPLPGGIREAGWEWAFDTLGTYHPGTETRMEVKAVEWG